jgi:hypothetical protein
MQRVVLAVVVILGLCLSACSDNVDEAEAILGTWVPPSPPGAFEKFEADGTFSVYYREEPPVDWGTYTLEDGILTMSSADDSYCGPDGSVVWEVTFSEDGNELHETNVSTICANEPHFALDRVLTKHSP